MPFYHRFSCFALCILVMPPLHAAGGHWATDDAGIVPEGECQIELWDQRRDSLTSETVVAPACNFGAGIEWRLQLAQLRAANDEEYEVTGGATYLFREMGRHGYGLGVVVEGTYNQERERAEVAEVTIPFTVPFFDDRMHFHVNAGWEYDRNRINRHDATWATAMDMELWGNMTLIGEVFGSDSINTTVQGGFRYEFSRWDAQFDMSWLRESGDDNDVWTTFALAIFFGS